MTRMDCETFDRDVVDLLYEDGEDEARDALALHAASCARCGATLASLRAAREQASRLPRPAVPEGLTSRILEAERTARRPPPLSRRVARAASWAGSLAMRPQFAMAALFCLAVGSSLLLLRARSDSVPRPTSVREEGLPSPEPAAAPAAIPAAPRASARSDGPARGDGEARRAPDPPSEQADAAKAIEAPVATTEPAAEAEASAAARAPAEGGGAEPARALAAARERLHAGGCDAALPDLRGVVATFAGTAEADAAGREIDACSRAVAAAPPPAGGAPKATTARPPPAKPAPSASD